MEAVYIIEGLLRQKFDAQRDVIHADTQGHYPCAFAHLFGFDLQQPADAAGIASATISWSDGSRRAITSGRYHPAHAKPGTYRLTVTVADRVGNVTTALRAVRIVPKPKPAFKRRRPRGRGRRA